MAPFLEQYDAANSAVGAERNKQKTEVLYFADPATLETKAAEWRLEDVRQLSEVKTAASSSLTLGVAMSCEEGTKREEIAGFDVGVVARVAIVEQVAVRDDFARRERARASSMSLGR